MPFTMPDATITYVNTISWTNQLARAIWAVIYTILFRPSPRSFHAWRRTILRLFGARVGRGAHPYPSCKIWAPWNLVMGEHACLGPYVDCYNVARIEISEYATVSQYSYLCSATHDYTKLSMPLIPQPIRICARAWVAAAAFVGPGITVGEGAVVGARSCVVKNVPAWTIVAGNPARIIKSRTLSGVLLDVNQPESTVS